MKRSALKVASVLLVTSVSLFAQAKSAVQFYDTLGNKETAKIGWSGFEDKGRFFIQVPVKGEVVIANQDSLASKVTVYAPSFQGDGSKLTGVKSKVDDVAGLVDSLKNKATSGHTHNFVKSVTTTAGSGITLSGTADAVSVKVSDLKDTHLSSGAVTKDKIGDGAVTVEKIGAGAVTKDKISATNIGAGKALFVNSSNNALEWKAIEGASETDPTVPANLKDGVAASEVSWGSATNGQVWKKKSDGAVGWDSDAGLTSLSSGTGTTTEGNKVNVVFDGSGSQNKASRSDHGHKSYSFDACETGQKFFENASLNAYTLLQYKFTAPGDGYVIISADGMVHLVPKVSNTTVYYLVDLTEGSQFSNKKITLSMSTAGGVENSSTYSQTRRFRVYSGSEYTYKILIQNTSESILHSFYIDHICMTGFFLPD